MITIQIIGGPLDGHRYKTNDNKPKETRHIGGVIYTYERRDETYFYDFVGEYPCEDKECWMCDI